MGMTTTDVVVACSTSTPMFWKKPPPPPPPEPPPEPASPPEPPPERRFTDRLRQPETVLGPGIRLVGHIEGSDSVEIGGSVEGNVTIKGLCRVRAGATLKGDLTASYAVLDGRVVGRVTLRRKAELGGSAHVEADIQAEGVAIAEGCFFDGRVHMVGGENDGNAESAPSRRNDAPNVPEPRDVSRAR